MSNTCEPHIEALNKAKIALMNKDDSAFFTSILFSLKIIWDDKIPTACTNGVYIKLSPKFFMSLDTEERVFLMLHESCHCAYLHMARMQDRKMRLWNIACDHVINLMLIARKFKMPKMGLADPQFTGMGSEEVYKILLADPQEPPPGFDIDLENPPEDVPPEQLQEQIQDILVRAAIRSKQEQDKPGTIPGDIQVFLDKLLNPKLPWHRILQKYTNALVRNNYSFAKPNRRHFPAHYLPTLYSESLETLAVAVDISGSVSDHDFGVFISEVTGIFRQVKPREITLIQFNTQITSVDKCRSIKELKDVKFVGRGGTRIDPVLQWANENKPQLLLVFTDGGFRFSDLKTKSNTVWVIHNNPNWSAPFGRVIHYEI